MSIYTVDTHGRRLHEVVPPTYGLEHPDWSPGGLITFNIAPEASDVPNAGSIMSVRPDGRGLRVLKAATERFAFFKPIWAPDGRQLLTGCFDRIEITDNLCVMNADGRNLRCSSTAARSPSTSQHGAHT